MINYNLSEIYIYPIKSFPGISLQQSKVEERGLEYDRRWMLVDEGNNFVTQRTHPQMALVNIKIESNHLSLSHGTKNFEDLRIPIDGFPSKESKVRVWDDFCEALEYSNEINEWFSEAIESKVKLVYMPDSSQRKTSTKYFSENKNVSFADGYPILILGQESLNVLNSKLDHQIGMNRFRPNLVFSSGLPHDEDNWDSFEIGTVDFKVIKPCARCVLTTVNPQTGIKGKEPLSTLSTYRSKNNKVLFGLNLIVGNEGIIKIGDSIIVKSKL